MEGRCRGRLRLFLRLGGRFNYRLGLKLNGLRGWELCGGGRLYRLYGGGLFHVSRGGLLVYGGRLFFVNRGGLLVYGGLLIILCGGISCVFQHEFAVAGAVLFAGQHEDFLHAGIVFKDTVAGVIVGKQGAALAHCKEAVHAREVNFLRQGDFTIRRATDAVNAPRGGL